MVALEIERSLFAAKAPSNPIFFIKHPKTLTLICIAESSSSHNNPTKRNPTPGNRKIHRRKYGTSRRSILKKSLNQEQLIFTTPISEDPVVRIIGGGISGLMCALNLEQRVIRSTVFDTVSKGEDEAAAAAGNGFSSSFVFPTSETTNWRGVVSSLAPFEDSSLHYRALFHP